MSQPSNNFGSLSQSAQLQKLKGAKVAMWIVGILTIGMQVFLYLNIEKEFDDAFEKEVAKQGTSMAAINNLDAGTKAEIEKERTAAIAKGRLIYGAGIGLGVIFIICALMVDRKPVIATMTGLVLYLGSIAAMAAFDSTSLAKGIIMKVIIIVVLASAVKAAIAFERDNPQKPA